jgi:hypothetical protein
MSNNTYMFMYNIEFILNQKNVDWLEEILLFQSLIIYDCLSLVSRIQIISEQYVLSDPIEQDWERVNIDDTD